MVAALMRTRFAQLGEPMVPTHDEATLRAWSKLAVTGGPDAIIAAIRALRAS